MLSYSDLMSTLICGHEVRRTMKKTFFKSKEVFYVGIFWLNREDVQVYILEKYSFKLVF